MTKRQWIILQVALLVLNDEIGVSVNPSWWDDDDGPVPTTDEISELVRQLARTDHERGLGYE